MRSRASKPTFVWQGIFILLPVFFLAGLGIYSLRQDKQAIEREAMEQASKIAEELHGSIKQAVISGPFNIESSDSSFPKITFRDAAIPLVSFHDSFVPMFPLNRELKDALQKRPKDRTVLSLDAPLEDPIFQIANQKSIRQVAVFNGAKMIYPLEYALSPAAANPYVSLSEAQILTLQTARALQATSNVELAQKKYEELLGTNLAERALLNVKFELAQLFIKSGKLAEADKLFTEIVEDAGWTESPAGIPLASLAAFKPAEIIYNSAADGRAKRDAVAIAGATAVYFPSVVSEILLARLQAMELKYEPNNARLITTDWLAVWKTHQLSRELVERKPPGTSGWIEHAERWRFAHLSLDDRLTVFKAQTISDVQARIDEATAETKKYPAYFNFGIEVGAHPFRQTNTEPSIGSITRTLDSGEHGGIPTHKITVAVIRPEILFSHYRRRQLWTSLLISAAALTSVIGFGAAFLSFRRQQRLAEMKSNFVSSVSHELRAPIASVRLMAEGLERERITEPEKQKEYFRFIGQECRRLSSLIENVLDFSRIEQGRKQYEFEPTDLMKLVGETVKLMEPYAAEKNVKLCCETAGLPTTHAQPVIDGRAIQQALINLIDNAIKHSPSGAVVTLRVADAANVLPASRWQAEGKLPARRQQHVALCVEDHGPGIPPHEQEKIFERFYRLGSELRRETQGIGIGLSIVKHIIEAHGGRVLVESETGKGSRFTVELPVNTEN